MIGDKKRWSKPKRWKHPEPIAASELKQMRDEFWDTAPHYGGKRGNLAITIHVLEHN